MPFKDIAKLNGPYGKYCLQSKFVIFLSTLLVMHIGVIGAAFLKNIAPNSEFLMFNSGNISTILILHMLLIIVFGLWVYRSCKNAWLLDSTKMKTSPLQAVGYFFTPIFFLWKPWSTMEQVRKSSFGQSSKLKTPLLLWWVFVLLTSAFIIIISLLIIYEKNPNNLIIIDKLCHLLSLVAIILDIFTLIIVISISHAQNHKAVEWLRQISI